MAAAGKIYIFGRPWTVAYHALPAFYQRHAALDPLALAALVGSLGLLLAFAAFGVLRNREARRTMEREEERFAYSIVDAAPQALLVADETGRIIRANPYAERIFGWSRAELVARAIEDLVPADLRQAHVAMREGYDFQTRTMGQRRELMALKADGTQFPALIHLAPLIIGERRLVVAGITDMSAERAALAVLAASEQRRQELADALPQLIWTCDSAGNCDFLSRQWLVYTGIPVEQQLGSGWVAQVHPDDRDSQIAAWKRSIDTATPFITEFRLRRHDGAYRLFYTRAEPVFDATGNVTRWIGSNTDIEERHQAELRVRALLEEMEVRVVARTAELDTALRDLRNILDAIPSMIAYWDRNQVNRFANQAYEHWFGVDPDWLTGRHMRELLGDTLYEKNRPFIEATLRGEVQIFERELTDSQGQTHATQAHYLPDIKDGEVLGFYVLVFDVSALKASEVAQTAAREAAENATRAKSAFLTSMSHELRTPMNSILGFADLLVGQFFGKLNDKQAEYAGIIKRSGEHLLRLMDEVLELSKIEAGRVNVSIEPVNVVAGIRSAVATLQPLADKYQVTINARSVGADDNYVSADLTRLSQVLINLGSNAIKYNRPGGWVKFSCEEKPDDILRITVSDNGRGIPKDRQAGAFQPFNRMGAEQGAIEGTGIGLALVKNLVEMMGGRIGFESTEGEGSAFWIDMKIAPPEDTEIDESIIASPNAPVPELKAGTRILYVEDNENNRLLFRHFMAVLKDVEILEAEDGTAGLAVARAQKPDIIFLDINLPGLSGFDVLREIKADPQLRDTPVIALTANAMAGDAERGLALGFHAYLTKPVRLDRILRTVMDLQQRKETTAGT